MKYLDLYGGIGGFRLGIERATRDWKCVWYCDIDKYATKVYNRNFSENNAPSDVRKIPAGSIPEHDLICAGYPCQAFSLAGRRAGFEDTRGTLFFEICRIAKECGTPYLFLENVKGLLSHDAGRTFATILMALDDLGYRVQWEVLNSKNYGVPQNRERVFIIANLRDRPAPEILPLGQSGGQPSEMERASEGGGEGLANEVTSAVRAGDKWQDAVVLHSSKNPVPVDVCPTVRATEGKHGDNQSVILHNVYGGFGETVPRVFKDYSPTIRTPAGGGHIPMVLGNIYPSEGENGLILDPDGIAKTLKSGETDNPESGGIGSSNAPKIMVGTITEAIGTRQGSSSEFLNSVDAIRKTTGRIRRLTPTECERLQGFPDGWTKCDGISDSQRYKMLGNAVTVNVIQAIAEKWVSIDGKEEG